MSLSTENQVETHDPYAALRLPDCRHYLAGSFAASMGLQMQTVAVGWDLYERTGDPLALGLIGLVQIVPVVALTLPAGHLADQADRRRILLTANLLLCLCSLGLALISWWSGPVWLVYAALFAIGVVRAFQGPVRSAFLPQIVPKERFSNAITWSSSSFQFASVCGPAIAGLLIALFKSATLVYLLDAMTMLLFFSMVLSIRRPPFVPSGKNATFASLAAGGRFVWNTKIVLAAITLDMFAVLLGGAVALLPIYAKDILGVGPSGFGWMRAAPAVGALTMSLVIAHRPPMQKAGKALLWAVAGFGVATIIFGVSRLFWLSLLMLFFTGVFDNISVVVRHTLVQTLTPDAMRGRVSAVNGLFIGLSNELGDFESGFAAKLFGQFLAPQAAAMTAVVSGGVGTLVVVAAVALIWPQVRKFGALDGKSAA